MKAESIKLPRRVVVDASFILSHLLPDEDRPFVEKIFDLYTQGKVLFIASIILPFEVVNSIKVAYARKRIPLNLARKLVQLFSRLEIFLEAVPITNVFDLATNEKLSVYDACYLSLARKYENYLLTLDKDLSRYSKVKLLN